MMNEVIKTALIAPVVAAALFVGVDFAMTTPDVLVSYSSNACVEVVNYSGVFFDGGNYNCENLPSKYNQVYVK